MGLREPSSQGRSEVPLATESFPFFRRSGQWGVFIAVHTLLGFSLLLSVVLFQGGQAVSRYVVDLGLGIIGFGCGALALASRLRCPACRTRVYFFVMKSAAASSWFGQGGGLRWESCPSCGSDGGSASGAAQQSASPDA
jgi:hypothetical protein